MEKLEITEELRGSKALLLDFFRKAIAEKETIIASKREKKDKAKIINKIINDKKNKLLDKIERASFKKNWNQQTILETYLMVLYASFVVMLEARNTVWNYNDIDFSRRIGEFWEPFCKTCFEHPLNPLEEYTPPQFEDFQQTQEKETNDYINSLNLTSQEKQKLEAYYNNAWNIVKSGKIDLKSDLHFTHKHSKYVIDFKSSFGSNEKGNTNRMLTVGSIYNLLGNEYKCLILVRSQENNHYLDILNESNLWEVHTDLDAYAKIQEFTDYDIHSWIEKHIDWLNDFLPSTRNYLIAHNLTPYLKW